MECPFYDDINMYGGKKVKEWRPQVLIGMLVLGIIGYFGMYMGYDTIAGVAVGGVVSAVTNLSQNSKGNV